MRSLLLTTLLAGIVAVTAFVPESDEISTNSGTPTSISTNTPGEVLLVQAPGAERRRVRRRTRRRVNRRHNRRENNFSEFFQTIWA